MDESQSQKGRTEEQFVNFYLSSAVPFCHCSVHPSLSVSWDSFVCVVGREKEDSIHVLQKIQGTDFVYMFIFNILLQNSHNWFPLLILFNR